MNRAAVLNDLGARSPHPGGAQPHINWHHSPTSADDAWRILYSARNKAMVDHAAMTPYGRNYLEKVLRAVRGETEGSGGTLEQVMHFPSLATLTGWLEETGLPLVADRHNRYPSMPTGKLLAEDTIRYRDVDEFNRTKNPKSGYQLLRYGWQEGRERLAAAMMEFDQQFRREVEKPTWNLSTAGIELDIGAYMSGHPEHMYEYSPGQEHAKAVSITVDTNVRCSACGRRAHDAEPTPPNWLLFRGVAVTMLVQYLMRAGYQVTLRTVTHTSYGQPDYLPGVKSMNAIAEREGFPLTSGRFMRTVVVDVLTPGRTVDLDSVMFALSHEDYVRRFDFLLHEANNYQPLEDGGLQSEVTWDYGYSREESPCPVGDLPLNIGFMLPLLSSVDHGGSDIYLPSVMVSRDLLDALGPASATPQGLTPGGREAVRFLMGENFAVGAPFHDLAGAAVWTLEALESLGVRLV